MSGMAVVGAPIGPPGKEGEVLGRDGIFLRVRVMKREEGYVVACKCKNYYLFQFLSFSAPQIQEKQKPRIKSTNGFVLNMFFFLNLTHFANYIVS